MRYATAGTVLAAQKALQHGYAINLGGGFHHAETDRGCGFCAFGDIQLAVEKVREEKPDARILIVDLDAHQGNGYEEYVYRYYKNSDKKPYIFDMYNGDVFPGKSSKPISSVIDKNIKLPHREENPLKSKDGQYNYTLKTKLASYIDELERQGGRPDLILYNAGTDTYRKDDVGCLNMSKSGIVERDKIVWRIAEDKKIPIMMTLSGGYTPQSVEIIKNSLQGILLMRKAIRVKDMH